MQVKKKHKTKVKMWESEKKLFNLKYRFAEPQSKYFEEQNSIEDVTTVESVITFLEEAKYHYLQYYIVF